MSAVVRLHLLPVVMSADVDVNFTALTDLIPDVKRSSIAWIELTTASNNGSSSFVFDTTAWADLHLMSPLNILNQAVFILFFECKHMAPQLNHMLTN